MLCFRSERFDVYLTRNASGKSLYRAVSASESKIDVFCTATIDLIGPNMGPYVDRIFTAPEYRGLGIALELLLLISEQIGELDLEAETDEGAALIRSYRDHWLKFKLPDAAT